MWRPALWPSQIRLASFVSHIFARCRRTARPSSSHLRGLRQTSRQPRWHTPDLETLRAAINHHAKEGFHRGVVRVSLPPKGEARDRWLTRKEAAALIWHCWRHREKQTIHSGSSKGDHVSTSRRPLRHIARFILIGLYTGTRAGAIAAASPYAEPGRSYVDLERGIFYRKPIGKRATKKRQTPAPIPPAPAGAPAAVARPQTDRELLRRVQRQAGCLGEEGLQERRRAWRA